MSITLPMVGEDGKRGPDGQMRGIRPIRATSTGTVRLFRRMRLGRDTYVDYLLTLKDAACDGGKTNRHGQSLRWFGAHVLDSHHRSAIACALLMRIYSNRGLRPAGRINGT